VTRGRNAKKSRPQLSSAGSGIGWAALRAIDASRTLPSSSTPLIVKPVSDGACVTAGGTPPAAGVRRLVFSPGGIGNSVVVGSLLHTYLQDHFAGATFGHELAEHCRRSSEGSEFGPPLAELAHDIAADRKALVAVMQGVGANESSLKVSVAWLTEKLSRVKPNGRLFGRTPLTRLVELESLAVGIAGKRALWRALAVVQSREDGLGGFDFAALEDRADDQLSRVEGLRLRAASLAFGSKD
jgi:hypothetical protein